MLEKDKILIPELKISDEEFFILKNKAEKLFKDRILPLIEINDEFYDKLLNLQSIVLMADWYFENNFELEENILKSLWEKLEKVIEDIGYPKDRVSSLLLDIKEYEKIEKDLRKGISLSSYKISKFYIKKSCDVRLQREIALFLKNKNIFSSPEEIAIDQLGEILDDIEDFYEDSAESIVNGNRFLEMYRNSPKKTKNEYSKFVSMLFYKFKNNKKLEKIKNEIDLLLSKF